MWFLMVWRWNCDDSTVTGKNKHMTSGPFLSDVKGSFPKSATANGLNGVTVSRSTIDAIQQAADLGFQMQRVGPASQWARNGWVNFGGVSGSVASQLRDAVIRIVPAPGELT